MFTFLQGKKTYIVGIATLLYAAFGYFQGFISAEQAAQLVSPALLVMGLRNAK